MVNTEEKKTKHLI